MEEEIRGDLGSQASEPISGAEFKARLRHKARIVDLIGSLPVILIAFAGIGAIVIGYSLRRDDLRASGMGMPEATDSFVRKAFPDLITPSPQRFRLMCYDPLWKCWIFRYEPSHSNDRSIEAFVRHAAASGWRQVGESYHEACLEKTLASRRKSVALVRWRRHQREFEVFASHVAAKQDAVKWWKDLGHLLHMTSKPPR